MFSQVLPEPPPRISRRPKIETMYSFKEMPSPSTLFSTYASIATSVMLFRTMANELIPRPIRDYIFSAFAYFFKHKSDKLTLVIEEQNGMSRNQLYDASETYLCTKISPKAERLKISKSPKEKNLTIQFEKGEMIVDSYEGIDLKWRFLCAESNNNIGSSTNTNPSRSEKRYFELSFDKKNKGKVLCSYLNFVLTRAKAAKDEEKVLKIFTLGNGYPSGGWESINLEHPANFDTLAMDPDLKRAIVEDLDRFVRRKEFYKKVGRAWKRGYLLYGPPGTGKSSLIAAMANYLKFDVYDLQLGNLTLDSELRRLLPKTANKSILVIEDIDCSVDCPIDNVLMDASSLMSRNNLLSLLPFKKLTLSGLLNFIDGLWSSCGDERIIVFTTNHKDRLDPALLRPGRMDVHIHMSYCTIQGFKLLASNYLGIPGHHRLYGEIESLFEDSKVTPAQVAEELMRSEDPEIALGGVIKLLKRKTMEGDEVEDNAANGFEVDETKRQKIENGSKGAVRKLRKSGRRRKS